uniref:Uncharacterized protein n=1 Tax=Physcomitrium patens TaxID=3218 RepID=A0A2K1JE94_PHYPA|nr:hypothetical protein PHYPA_020135 [Physcomitrium patens]
MQGPQTFTHRYSFLPPSQSSSPTKKKSVPSFACNHISRFFLPHHCLLLHNTSHNTTHGSSKPVDHSLHRSSCFCREDPLFSFAPCRALERWLCVPGSDPALPRFEIAQTSTFCRSQACGIKQQPHVSRSLCRWSGTDVSGGTELA